MISDLMAYIQFKLGAEVDPSGRALSDTSWAEQLHGSEHMWMLIEGAHVLTLMLFAGTILLVDLRLLGALLRKTPVSKVTDTVLPYTLVGFAAVVLTGTLLFLSNPFGYYHNFWFRLKFVFVALAALNIFFFHFKVQKTRANWDHLERPPRAARASAAASLALWTIIIISGRFVAYDWFDCDRAQGWLAAASECSARNLALERIEGEIL